MFPGRFVNSGSFMHGEGPIQHDRIAAEEEAFLVSAAARSCE